MRHSVRIFVFLLIAAALCFADVAKGGRKGAHKAKPTPPPVQQEPVAPPPRPLTPEEMPANPPKVGMNNGMLTIAAENSTLGDVLTAVRNATGASIEVPPAARSERVVVQLGPGQPRDVIGNLLTGSKFDYIIVGSPQDGNSVQRVILTARSSGPVGPNRPQMANNASPHQPSPQTYQPPPEDTYQPPEDVNADMDEEPPDHPEPTPEIPEEGATPNEPQPIPQGQQQPGQPGQPVQPQNQDQNQGGPRTPEQLLQELQRLQQQQGNRQPEE